MQSADNISKHKHLVDLPELQRGLDFALMHLQGMWCEQVKDQTSAMAVGLKLQGVLEFIQTFKLLAETAPKSNLVVVDNLAGNRQ